MKTYIEVLKNFTDFRSRAGRREFWMFVLFNFLISFVLPFLAELLKSGFIMVIFRIYVLIIIVPSWAVSVRRLHDIGKTGWLVLVNLIPYVGNLIMIFLACLDSEPGTNKYGPNPNYASAKATNNQSASNDIFCPHCGQQTPDGKYCAKCGKEI